MLNPMAQTGDNRSANDFQNDDASAQVDAGTEGDSSVLLLEALACLQAGRSRPALRFLRQLQHAGGLPALIARLYPDLPERSDAQAQRVRALLRMAPSGDAADSEFAELSPQQGTAPRVLTTKQRAIMRCIRDGLSNREIAAQLQLSHNTVKWHLKEIFSRLGVGTRSAALGIAEKRSWL